MSFALVTLLGPPISGDSGVGVVFSALRAVEVLLRVTIPIMILQFVLEFIQSLLVPRKIGELEFEIPTGIFGNFLLISLP